MMIDLTPEVRQAIEGAGDQPPRLVDPQTQQEYVLLKADVYDRMRFLLGTDEELTPTELTSQMWAVMKDEWDDPSMDVYDRDVEVS